MLENGTENVFSYQDYQALKIRLKKMHHSLYFEADKVVIVRVDSTVNRDVSCHIVTYTTKTLPPYERVLKDIEDAAEQFKRELSQRYSGIQVPNEGSR